MAELIETNPAIGRILRPLFEALGIERPAILAIPTTVPARSRPAATATITSPPPTARPARHPTEPAFTIEAGCLEKSAA
jgi:hypothetical protein